MNDGRVILSINMPLDEVAFIERAQYESAGLRSRLEHIERNRMNNAYFFDAYYAYVEAYARYAKALEGARLKYVPSKCRTDRHRFTINYQTCCMIIEEVAA